MVQLASSPSPQGQASPAEAVLSWYDRHRRELPWRAAPGQSADPYRVWLSEIMLQQTTVVAVAPYFQRFLARWPDVGALAAAPLDDVLAAWAGLGYYARARNLHRCAGVVAGQHKGRFPDSEAALLELPGIGPYTAAAIAAIAFDRPATVVDGNVERVVARYFAVETPLPRAKAELRPLAAGLTPAQRSGDYAQAMMDLGATVCVPRNPRCLLCPLADGCQARAKGIAAALPRRVPKRAKPLRHAVAFWLIDGAGRVLLRRRPEKGLLGGMMEVPSTEWRETPWQAKEARRGAPAETAWTPLPGIVRHGFTHFDFEITLWAGRVDGAAPALEPQAHWCPLEGLADKALPSVMRKVVAHALKQSANF